MITLCNAKIPESTFGGTRVSSFLDLNFVEVNSLLFEIYFCIMNKLMNNNFNAVFEFWCLLSHEKFDKSTILLLAFTFKYNPTCKQGNFKHFVVSALNCLSVTIF